MAGSMPTCAICMQVLEPATAVARPHRAFAKTTELRFGATCAAANPVCAVCSESLDDCPFCRARYATTLPCAFIAKFQNDHVDVDVVDEGGGEGEPGPGEKHVYFSEATGLGELARELRDRTDRFDLELWLPMFLGPDSPGKGEWSVRAKRAVIALGMLESAGGRFREIELGLVTIFEESPSDLPHVEACMPVVDAACRVAGDILVRTMCIQDTDELHRLWEELQARADA